jgi:hypothetical protein
LTFHRAERGRTITLSNLVGIDDAEGYAVAVAGLFELDNQASRSFGKFIGDAAHLRRGLRFLRTGKNRGLQLTWCVIDLIVAKPRNPFGRIAGARNDGVPHRVANSVTIRLIERVDVCASRLHAWTANRKLGMKRNHYKLMLETS